MKKIIATVALASAMCVLAPQAGAQSLLDKAKKAVGNKVEGAVSAGLGKIMGGKQQSNPKTSNNKVSDDDFIYTARGAFNKGDDPYKLYVDALNEGTFEGSYYDAYKELTDMGDDKTSFAFKSISEVVAAYPGIPTARQMAISFERKASSEALRNYELGIANYSEVDMIQQANSLRPAPTRPSTGLSGNAAAVQKTVFEGAKKLGKTPDQLTESEIMAILQNADASLFTAVPADTDGQELDSVADRISAILDRAMSANVTIQKAERSLDQIVPELNAAWNDSEARQQVYDNEVDIDPRIVSYWDETHKNDYPEFWKEGRRAQNAIIDKFNIQQAVKWRKVLQAELEPYIALLQEIAAADAELESLARDKTLLDYAIAKNQINSAFMMVSLVVINVTQFAYAVPLVANTVEDGYGQ